MQQTLSSLINRFGLFFRLLVPQKPRNTIVVIKRSRRRWFKYHDDIIKMIQSEITGTDVKIDSI